METGDRVVLRGALTPGCGASEGRELRGVETRSGIHVFLFADDLEPDEPCAVTCLKPQPCAVVTAITFACHYCRAMRRVEYLLDAIDCALGRAPSCCFHTMATVHVQEYESK